MDKAFTLIELLVVVAILGILSSLGIGVYQEYRTKAYNANTESIGRNLYGLIEQVKSDLAESCPDSGGCRTYCSVRRGLAPNCIYNGVTRADIKVNLEGEIRNLVGDREVGIYFFLNNNREPAIYAVDCAGDSVYYYHPMFIKRPEMLYAGQSRLSNAYRSIRNSYCS